MTEKGFSATLGIIFWNAARHAEKQINFAGGHLEHIESSGILQREFTFKGDEKSTKAMLKYLRKLAANY